MITVIIALHELHALNNNKAAEGSKSMKLTAN
ncbi:hypothetical protein SAMN05720354_11713 [Nitrosospira sp. Nsp1]|nr:hypothetical protein SAMN05720354_11713 [Nitrosospira sp. Nsp1]